MDSVLKVEPYLMNDGRCFTDYRSIHETNNSIKKLSCNSTNNYNYKLCLINNFDSIKKMLYNDNFKNNFK
jgi:hypothetical protein